VSTVINYGDDVVLDIRCTSGQYHVEANGDRDNPWPPSPDALTTGEDNWFAVLCGTAHGHVTVQVQLLAIAPKNDIDDTWEMVGERDITVYGRGLQIIEIDAPAPFHTIETGAGTYRARIHVRRRWEARQANDLATPIENHLLQIWPTKTPTEPSALRGPDRYAQNYQ
jgi:hypothetical protein